jgi:lipoate-protein ligase A
MPDDILESYKKICGGLIGGLNELGIKAEFAPLNDVLASGKKISGNAQTRRLGCILQHGTILLDVDVDTMFSLLKVPSEKIRDKMIAQASQRVTSVKDILGHGVDFMDVQDSFIKGFQTALDVELTTSKPAQEEVKHAKKLQNTKYSADDWNYKR